MTITESDKRLLSFLAAVLLLLLLVFLVLRPLADKNSDLKRQITAAKDQEVVMDLRAALAEDAGTSILLCWAVRISLYYMTSCNKFCLRGRE